jgi:hypothetical protein
MSTIVPGDETTEIQPLAPTTHTRAELDVREHSGASVTLYWIRGTDVLIVAVVDGWGGPSFELVLRADEQPLDVFHHPYAYAAARGLDLTPIAATSAEEEEVVDV